MQRFYLAIYRGKSLIASIVVLSVAALALYFVFSTERYTATTQILIDIQQQQLISRNLAVPGLDMTRYMIGPVTDSQVEILQSARIAEQVIRLLGLHNDPYFAGERRGLVSTLLGSGPGLLSGLFGIPPQAATPAQEEAVAEAEYAAEAADPAKMTDVAKTQAEPIPAAVIDRFLENLDVKRKGLTLVLLVRFTDEDPVRAAQIANAVAETYLADQRQERLDVTQETSTELEKRMDTLRAQVLASERRVQEFREANELFSIGGLTVSEREIAETVTQLILARNEAANKAAILRQMEPLAADPNAVNSVTTVLESPVVRDLRRQAAEVSRKLATVTAQFGENDNQAITARAELRDVRNELSLEIQRIVQSAQNDYEIAKSRVKFFEDGLKQLLQRFGETNRLLIRLDELEREAKVTRDVYVSLLARQKETDVQAGILYPDARIFDYAAVPRYPAGPRKMIVLVLTLLGSLAIGVTVVILRDHIATVMGKSPPASADAASDPDARWWRRSA